MNEHHTAASLIYTLQALSHANALWRRISHFRGSADKTFKGLQQTFDFGNLTEPLGMTYPSLRVALQERKTELSDSKGYDFSQYSDEQLTDHYHYTAEYFFQHEA